MIIEPNEEYEIKFIYTIKDINENPDKHKFKFEAIIIPKNFENTEAKVLFNTLLINRIPVSGNTLKRAVQFNMIGMSHIPKPPEYY
jgi:hypothetical protein